MKVNEDRDYERERRRRVQVEAALDRAIEALDPATSSPTVRQRDELVDELRLVQAGKSRL